MESVEEIYNSTAGEVALQDSLQDLDASGDTANSLANDVSNGSKVSRNRAILWLVAYAMYAQTVLYELFRIETRELALDGHYGNKRWMVAKALEFQYGDPVIFTKKDAYYEVVNIGNRIVYHAAATEAANKVIIKVRGLNAKLSSDERTALQDYFDELRPPIKVIVRSADADRLRLFAKVITDAKQGTANIQSNVEQAINTYIKSLGEDGVFSMTRVQDEIRSVNGVVDVLINEASTRLAGSNEWNNITRIATTYAGWMKVDQGHPLSETIEYVSSNV